MLINSYKNDLNYYNSRNNFNCRMTKCLIRWSRLSVHPGRLKKIERFTWITFNLDNNNYAKKYVFKWKERTGDTLKLKIYSSVSFRIFQKCASVPPRTCITPCTVGIFLGLSNGPAAFLAGRMDWASSKGNVR